MTRIRVVVTAEDIRLGEVSEPDSCPLALALRRRGFADAEVGSDDWAATPGGKGFRLSEGAYLFREAFDSGQTLEWMAPKVFYLEGPDR